MAHLHDDDDGSVKEAVRPPEPVKMGGDPHNPIPINMISQPHVEESEHLPDVDVDDDPPPVGSRVLYHVRNGYMRGGRVAFPADVLGHHSDGTVELHIIYEKDDYETLQRVRRYTDDQPHHAYSIIPSAEGQLAFSEFGSMLTELKEGLEAMKAQVFGEYIDPPRSIMDILVDYESKLIAFGDRLDRKKG